MTSMSDAKEENTTYSQLGGHKYTLLNNIVGRWNGEVRAIQVGSNSVLVWVWYVCFLIFLIYLACQQESSSLFNHIGEVSVSFELLGSGPPVPHLPPSSPSWYLLCIPLMCIIEDSCANILSLFYWHLLH